MALAQGRHAHKSRIVNKTVERMEQTSETYNTITTTTTTTATTYLYDYKTITVFLFLVICV